MDQQFTLQQFIDTYTQSHGVEGAAQLLKETTRRLGINGKAIFTKQEAISICQDLQVKSGFVGIVAGILLNRFNQDS